MDDFISKSKIKYLLYFLIFSLGALRFYHLDAGLLWQDEAEYALLATNVANYGVPTRKYNPIPYMNTQIFDAYTIPHGLTKYEDINYLKDDLNTYYTWLPFYAIAGLYKIFGISATSARLFSALCGLLSGIFLFLLVSRFHGRFSALLSVFFFWSNFFLFYLHRSATHYSAAIFFEILVLWLHFNYLSKRTWKNFSALILALGLYFHSQVVFFALTVVILHIYHGLRRDFRFLLRMDLLLSPVVFGWIYWSHFWVYSTLVPINTTRPILDAWINLKPIFKSQAPLGLLFLLAGLYFVIKKIIQISKQKNFSTEFDDYIFIWISCLFILAPILAPWWLTPERMSSLFAPLSIVVAATLQLIFSKLKSDITKNVLLSATLFIPFIFVDSTGQSTFGSNPGAIIERNYQYYEANWVSEAIELLHQEKVKSNALIFASMDNLTFNFHSEFKVQMSWPVNTKYLEESHEPFWYFISADKNACFETTYLLKDHGESLCGAQSFWNKKIKTCREIRRPNFVAYECAGGPAN